MKGLISLVISAAPSIKGWIFSDGKFKKVRALYLLLFFITMILTIKFLNLDNNQMEFIVELLDEIGDILGYFQ